MALAQGRDWKLNVRRTLFTSSRFGVEKAEHSDGLEFYVVDKHHNWFLYPISTRTNEPHPVVQEEHLDKEKSRLEEIEQRFPRAGYPSSQTGDGDQNSQSPQSRDRLCKSTSSSGNSEALLTSPKRGKDVSVSNTRSTTTADSTRTTTARGDLTSDSALLREGAKMLKDDPHVGNDKEVEGNKCIEQSQQVSYKTELTFHTLCSNMEIGSFPGSLPF